jgi:hypothetical protein
MNEEKIKKIVADRWTKLPKEIQIFLANSNWQDQVATIMKKYELKETESSLTLQETILVLLGLADPSKFTYQIMTRTQITGEKAGAVAFAIEEQVLKNIKPSLAKAFELTKEENHENAINILDEYKQTTHGMHEATSIDQKVGMHQIDMLKKTLKESSITKKL